MSVTERVLGSPPVVHGAAALTRRRLRVLAYHDVTDRGQLRAQLTWLAREFEPVDVDDVASAVLEGTRLPDRAVWVTFDDANRSVVDDAMPLLNEAGIRATLFVCPGPLVDRTPYWWEVVRAAGDDGPIEVEGRAWTPTALEAHCKAVADTRRRSIVEELTARLAGTGRLPAPSTTDVAGLHRWTAGGHALGNHSWDHPCLDRCTAAEQRAQIARAHEWLHQVDPDARRVFAYPNGDATAEAEAVLRDLEYELGVLFDHRIVSRHPAPRRLSRLRISADADVTRMRAIVSGAHSAMFGLARSRDKPPAVG